ncbi:hypothetical protein M406DRAFT_275321 [Cryphonectria parasitica EP155]|uniref:Spindle pole body component n=1 Tax=Cryphonectria parasitica (strain ATCC 38755 / EP155) TaxID=660469 RepID=A0A9P4Y689_CRYP1|nr:uncharacterized protein M406DRAFT_275321 [Cryphonectria parasitica EP155]KAF3767692.1 hypothetical protein M406DRAFT_275321 [Cryphonectria parasitica EP155]
MIDSASEVEEDLWLFRDEAAAKLPEFKTWDGFALSKVNLELANFTTEAGASAYDIFLALDNNPCGLDSHSSYKTLDPRGWAACLLAVSLGRESVMFSWNEEKMIFTPALELTKVPGYSGDSLAGILQLCTSCGEACRRLRSYVEMSYSTNATPSRVALANALDKMLLVAQDELGARGLRVRSILQLQSLVRPVFAILSYFQKLVQKVKKAERDSAFLSIIYAEAQSAELGEPFLRDAMGEILRMVSKPFTDFVEEWIGLRPEGGMPISKNGPGKSFVRCDSHMWVDDQGFELEEPDYFLDMDYMPTFIPDDIAQAIFETGRNLRFLQSYQPQNPLSSLRAVAIGEPPRLEWQYDWESITRVEQKALAFHHTVLDTLRKHQVTVDDDRDGVQVDDGIGEEEPVLQFFGKDESHLEQTVLASIAHLDHPVAKVEPWDKLSRLLREKLFSIQDETDAIGTEFSPHWSLLPLLSFGPVIFTQARLVNRECLRLLYAEHNLREHLRLQRAFQLLGNGMFSSRLSNALFSPEMDTTERQAGVARSGGAMGLRLTSRDNWPPASSELRLALAGVLSESYQQTSPGADGNNNIDPLPTKHAALPGDLSFAIRDLSPEEMERCMDPDALEALDFLRMSYKPPPPLLPIMTPSVLVKYDHVFKMLLRVRRMLFVVDQLFRDMSSGAFRWQTPDDTSLRFRIEAHHFVSNIARYFFDTGIEKPWRGFERWLDKVEKGLQQETSSGSAPPHHQPPPSAVSPDRLGEQHERTLDEIMTALFLRKRQRPVLELLEAIFTLVLRFAKAAKPRAEEGAQGPAQEVQDLYRSFREKVEVFITVCRGLSEKSGYGHKRDRDRLQENPIEMLLLLLDMSNYYVKR